MNNYPNHTPTPRHEPDGRDVMHDIHTRRELALYRLLVDVTVNETHRRAHVYFMAAFFAYAASITCGTLIGKVAQPFPVAAAALTWLIVGVLTTLSGMWTLRTFRIISQGRALELLYHEARLTRRERAAGIESPVILDNDDNPVVDNSDDKPRRTPWWKRIDSSQVTFEAGFFTLILAAVWGLVLTGQSTWPTMVLSVVIGYVLRYAVIPPLERWILRRWTTRKPTDTTPEAAHD